MCFTGHRSRGEIIRGRLEAIEKGAAFAKNALDLDLIRDELLSSIPALNKMLVRWSWPARCATYIAQAGMQMRPGKLVLFSAVIGLGGVGSGRDSIRQHSGWRSRWAFAVAFLPLVFIAIKRARRLAAFQKEFPEVIDLLSRSVRAGHSFAAGMEIVATDLPEPVSTEFRITFDEQRFGLPLRDALLSLCAAGPAGGRSPFCDRFAGAEGNGRKSRRDSRQPCPRDSREVQNRRRSAGPHRPRAALPQYLDGVAVGHDGHVACHRS